MLLSRRNFLRTVSAGAAAGAVVQWPLSGIAKAAAFEPSRQGPPDGPVRLNSNENVYGPSPKAAAVMRSALAEANRYPFLEYDGLLERIANLHHVKPEQVLVGCGSTEILRVAAVAFLGPGKQALQASPTFEALEHYAQPTGGQVVSLPLTPSFAHDLDGMLARADAATTLIYICNPNNPTASLTPRKDLETFISKLPATCYVLMDEAYHHYVAESGTYASFLDHPLDDERVIVARTFSKVYGMAGLRLGYSVAAAATTKRMTPYMTQDNVNGIVIRAAIAALDDQPSVRDFVKRNADVRQEFFNQAMNRSVKPIDSHANFVMFNTDHPASEVIAHFRKQNVLIGRRFPAMESYIRVSLGTPQEMLAFWRAWDLLPFAKSAMHR